MRRTLLVIAAAGALLVPAANAYAQRAGLDLAWQLSATPTETARLRGLSPASAEVVWASGSGGTVLRSVDAGRTWASVGPKDAATLDFRDVEATSAQDAVALTIGEGGASRIYRTTDGGASWTESFRNDDPAAFYDCLAFSSAEVGYALADPVGGKFRVLKTTDAGASWQLLPGEGMPAAAPGEFAFAASGTCLQTDPTGAVSFATGGADPARVFRSVDGGSTWTVANTPVAGGETAGIYSLSYFNGRRGVAVGGDYLEEDGADAIGAYTIDGGRTWQPSTGLGGYRSGSAWSTRWYAPRLVLAVGPTGSDVSRDGGITWTTFDAGSFDAVECVRNGPCFASGEKGRFARLVAN